MENDDFTPWNDMLEIGGDDQADAEADEDGQADAEADDAEEYGEDDGFQPFDLSDDGDALSSAGMGTDEDYGSFDEGDGF